MRIWDVHPGYLNRQSLLGEHRELHGIVSILTKRKKGYSRHPETLRWLGYGWALRQRHRLLACEMALRGFNDRTPVLMRTNQNVWPTSYIDEPCRQYQLLGEKYADKEFGRIPLPKNAQELWSQHKYSVLARDPMIYKEIGYKASTMGGEFSCLAKQLTELLRVPPAVGGIRNAAHHMWGHVSALSPNQQDDINTWPLKRLLLETQKRAIGNNEAYLISSTALSELMAWLPGTGHGKSS